MVGMAAKFRKRAQAFAGFARLRRQAFGGNFRILQGFQFLLGFLQPQG